MSDAPGSLTLIAEGVEYALLSTPDGSAFVLRFKTDRLSARLQGEDAIRFQTDYQTIRAQYAGWQADQTLARLWDQGGYGWLAEEEGAEDADTH